MAKVLSDESQNAFSLKRVKVAEINHLFICSVIF